jgi:rod shape-determining protein MreB
MLYLAKRFFGMFSKDIGIDLGTCNTLVYVKGQGVVLSEPSVVAVKRGTDKVLMDGKGNLAVGSVAKEMIGKTHAGIVAIRPLKNGVIADFDITEAMISYFIRKVHDRAIGVMPRVVVAVPAGITTVEKRAVLNAAEHAGARRVYLIEEPMAAAIGAGLPMLDPVGNMIVDIGGGSAEIAIISLGGMVAFKSLRVAGDAMDEAIVKYVKQEYNLVIGEQTAEKIKITAASLDPSAGEERSVEVCGRDFQTAMPRRITISSAELRAALREPVLAIVRGIREVLEAVPPEISADLVEHGITMAGGTSMLRGIGQAIEDEIQIPVKLADEPMLCVVKGTGLIIEHLDRFRETLESSEEAA